MEETRRGKWKKEKNIRALFFGKILKYNLNRCTLKSIVVVPDCNETRQPKTYKNTVLR
jgi:hypothetical protein